MHKAQCENGSGDPSVFSTHMLYDMDYALQHEIGRGSYGSVFRAVHKITGTVPQQKIIETKLSRRDQTSGDQTREGFALKTSIHVT